MQKNFLTLKFNFLPEDEFCGSVFYTCFHVRSPRIVELIHDSQIFLSILYLPAGFYAGQAWSIDRPGVRAPARSLKRGKRKNSERSRSVIRNWAETTPESRLIQKFALLRVITKRVSTRYPPLYYPNLRATDAPYCAITRASSPAPMLVVRDIARNLRRETRLRERWWTWTAVIDTKRWRVIRIESHGDIGVPLSIDSSEISFLDFWKLWFFKVEEFFSLLG